MNRVCTLTRGWACLALLSLLAVTAFAQSDNSTYATPETVQVPSSALLAEAAGLDQKPARWNAHSLGAT